MAKSIAVKKGLVWIIILGIFMLAFIVLQPIMIPIILGLLLAYIFSPVYKTVQLRIGNKNLSAFVFLALLFSVVIAPLIYFSPIIAKQTFDAFSSLQNIDFSKIFLKYLDPNLARLLSSNMENILAKIVSGFLQQLTELLVNLPSFLLKVAVFLFTFFFALRDSDELRDYIFELSPFSSSTEKKFMEEFRGITNAIVFGQVLIGIIQGIALWVGLFIIGFPRSIVLGLIAAIVSIIPILGTWLVWLPTGLLLLISGKVFDGVFVLLYGGLFVSSLDNLIRPYLLSRKSELPVALSVIGTIGGLYVFGLTGLILGPLILAYALIIVEFYRKGKLDELFKKK
ncbi:AI-2E family transporter [Candidatus Pacearchaeota archaeon]|nr:MAG: AI-2E family transporter [Candidatus Pacearchaeota archaeon]